MKGIGSKVLAEFFGTFMIVFMGCGGLMASERFPGMIPAEVIPVIFGLAVMTMIYAVGHISGGHFNPAVTIAFTAVRHFPVKNLIAYCSAQFLGGITAMFFLVRTLPAGELFGATLPSVNLTSAFLWEGILSFFLMFVIISVATDTRAVGIMAGVAIGAAIALCAFVGGPVTGGSMNPARSFAPALFSGQWHALWIYLSAPVAGAVSGAFTYEAIRCGNQKNDNIKGCC